MSAVEWGSIGINAVDSLLGQIGAGKRAKKAYERQVEENKRQAKENYEYGELAADNAHERSLGLLAAETEANSLVAQTADAKAAGLSPGVFSGMVGGQGASAGGGAQGGGARGMQAADLATIAGIENEKQSLRIEGARQRADEILQLAEAKRIKAETKNIEEQTDTSQQLTPVEVELKKQEAVQKYIENIKERERIETKRDEGGKKKREDGEISVNRYYNKNLDIGITISEGAAFDRELTNEIARAVGELGELNAKQQEIWNNITNATRKIELDEVKTQCIKMAAEFEYGEKANWKWWYSKAAQGIGAITNLIGL